MFQILNAGIVAGKIAVLVERCIGILGVGATKNARLGDSRAT